MATLTLAFWTKQTTLVASVGYAGWLLGLTIARRRPWRFTVLLLGLLVAVNVVVLGALLLATGGWELYFNFLLPARQATIYGPS